MIRNFYRSKLVQYKFNILYLKKLLNHYVKRERTINIFLAIISTGSLVKMNGWLLKKLLTYLVGLRVLSKEMIATVLFSYDELCKDKQVISDKDVYDFVISWKPYWEKDKNYEVCDTIHNLAMLSLISVTHSNLLLDTSLI